MWRENILIMFMLTEEQTNKIKMLQYCEAIWHITVVFSYYIFYITVYWKHISDAKIRAFKL